MFQFSILKINDNEYLLSIVNAPRKYIRMIEEDNFEGARIRHMVSSSTGYAVYEIYGEDAGTVASKIEKYIARLLTEGMQDVFNFKGKVVREEDDTWWLVDEKGEYNNAGDLLTGIDILSSSFQTMEEDEVEIIVRRKAQSST